MLDGLRYAWRIAPDGPLAIGGTAVVLVLAAMVAAYVPARHATRIDPLAALRA